MVFLYLHNPGQGWSPISNWPQQHGGNLADDYGRRACAYEKYEIRIQVSMLPLSIEIIQKFSKNSHMLLEPI